MTEVNREELEMFRDMLLKVMEAEVAPHYEQWDEQGIMPRELWNTLGDAGLLCVDVDEDNGGCGVPFEYSTLVAGEIARLGYGALATNVMVHSDIVAPYISHLANEEQRQYWLPKMVSGEVVGAIAMTEPGAGSDLQGVKTTAIRQGDHYILNGSKTFITNGQLADLVIVVAKTDPKEGAKGTSLLLVETAWEGFEKGQNLNKVGMKAQDTSELFFQDVKVPAGNLLGSMEGQGFFQLMQELPAERLQVALTAVAAAEAAWQWTLDYVRERKAFGKPVLAFQNTRFKLAELKADITAARVFCDRCLELHLENKLDVPTAAMLKQWTTDLQCKVMDECVQLHGGYGYMWEYPIARAWADSRVQRIYAGTNEIMKEIVARSF